MAFSSFLRAAPRRSAEDRLQARLSRIEESLAALSRRLDGLESRARPPSSASSLSTRGGNARLMTSFATSAESSLESGFRHLWEGEEAADIASDIGERFIGSAARMAGRTLIQESAAPSWGQTAAGFLDLLRHGARNR